MMIHNIRPIKKALKNRKRVGRGPGSGNGKTAGKGHKGQKSRSGYSRKFGFEGGQMPLVRRIPKRGFTNALFRKEYQIVNVGQLNVVDVEEVKPEVLKKLGLIKKADEPVKILGEGKLEKKLKVYAHKFSGKAIELIEKAGGEAIVIK